MTLPGLNNILTSNSKKLSGIPGLFFLINLILLVNIYTITVLNIVFFRLDIFDQLRQHFFIYVILFFIIYQFYTTVAWPRLSYGFCWIKERCLRFLKVEETRPYDKNNISAERLLNIAIKSNNGTLFQHVIAKKNEQMESLQLIDSIQSCLFLTIITLFTYPHLNISFSTIYRKFHHQHTLLITLIAATLTIIYFFLLALTYAFSEQKEKDLLKNIQLDGDVIEHLEKQ